MGKSSETKFVVTEISAPQASVVDVEMCEHKGIGHPDSICDGVAEAVSLALCSAYLLAYGRVMHFNVDKALLVGGESQPKFSGGELVRPLRLIVCGRATALPNTDLDELVCSTARRYLQTTLHCDVSIFSIESAVHNGCKNLQLVLSKNNANPLANDTSFGVGFAPYSRLERNVLHLSETMRSDQFLQQFPAAGDDFKIMGSRVGSDYSFTVALALMDRDIHGLAQYFRIKQAIENSLRATIEPSMELHLNRLDDADAINEEGIYLTVTGLSAEHGDDGQVGRGNRINGLITPCRSMSLEAAAGKNPVSHVGKIYNVIAMQMAQAIVDGVPVVSDVTVKILSTIGQPVQQPSIVAIEVSNSSSLNLSERQKIFDVARAQLECVETTSQRLVRGELRVF